MCRFRFARHALLAAAVSLLAACTEDQPAPLLVHTYAMGDRINIGHLVYQVFEAQWRPALGEDNDLRVPQNRFFILRLSATNSGSGNELVPNMTLEDEAGNAYPELKDGSKVPLWVGYLRQVAPADSIQGTVVFDVAPKRYKLRLWDEEHNNSALVEMPLQFDDQNKGIPTQQ
ncbi:MAG: hypothetical protein ABSH56_29400 [Bryobacteraceae bacterium]|jgi:hypothetical protein